MRHPTSTSTQLVNHPDNAAPDTLMAIAASVNGNARPSFNPASEVRANRASSSASGFSSGSPTWTSEASTGSVGARAAAISTAPATPRPSAAQPRNPTATIDSGIVIASRRQVDDHVPQPNGRLIASPAPMSDTMTVTSVRCRATSALPTGSGDGSCGRSVHPSRPAAKKTIGTENGARRSRIGNRAAASMTTPTAAKSAPAGSRSSMASL